MNKKLVGFGAIGLATVFSVAATSVTFAESNTSGNADVQVVVSETNPDLNITTPQDGAIFRSPKIPIEIAYSRANNIEYGLDYVSASGEIIKHYELETYYVMARSGGSGVHSWYLDMPAVTDNLFGDYVLSAKINGIDSTEEQILFHYRAMGLTSSSKTESKTNNPIVEIQSNYGVDHINIQVFDQNGKKVFKDPITVKNLNDSTTRSVTLDLFSLGVASGTYKVVATPYDAAGNVIDNTTTTTVTYTAPRVPEVPNTPGDTSSDDDSGSIGSVSTGSSDGTETGNPVINVDFGEDTEYVEVQVYDKDGNPVFDKPLKIKVKPGQGAQSITLDLASLGLPSGEYSVSIIAYDANGKVVGKKDNIGITYKAPAKPADKPNDSTPSVPNTGVIAESLGISESDLILSVSVIFFAAVIAFFFIMKKVHRESAKSYRRKK